MPVSKSQTDNFSRGNAHVNPFLKVQPEATKTTTAPAFTRVGPFVWREPREASRSLEKPRFVCFRAAAVSTWAQSLISGPMWDRQPK